MFDLFVQVLGFIAFFLLTISYWQKRKIIFVILQLLANAVYATHYYFLGGFSGVLCNLIGVVILFLLLIKEKVNKECFFLLPIILFLFVPVVMFTYNGIWSVFPILATIIPNVVNFQKNMDVIKIGGILGTGCWLIYAIYLGSYSIMLTDIIFIISTICSMGLSKYSYKRSEVNV